MLAEKMMNGQHAVRWESYVVADGVASSPIRGGFNGPAIDPAPIFTPNNHLIYIEPLWDPAKAGNEDSPLAYRLIMDGHAGPNLGSVRLISAGIADKSHYFEHLSEWAESPDGRHFAYSADIIPAPRKMADKSSVFLDGVPGPLFQNIFQLQLSDDGTHLGYSLSEDRFCLDSVVTDGSQLTLHRATNRVAYVIKKGKGFAVVTDDKEGDEYDQILLLGFSPQGKHVYYVARQNNQKFFVIDGQESDGYEILAGLVDSYGAKPGIVFSPDEKTWAFVGRRPHSQSFEIVRNWKRLAAEGFRSWELGPDGVLILHEGFAANGDRLVYLDDKLIGRDAVISPDGRRIATTVNAPDNHGVQVLVDGVAQPVYASVRALQFSADSRHFGYIAERLLRSGENEHTPATIVNVDGKESRPYHDISEFKFSPDGKHYGFAAERRTYPGKNGSSSDSSHTLVVDGQVEGLFFEDFVFPKPRLIKNKYDVDVSNVYPEANPWHAPFRFLPDDSVEGLVVDEGTVKRFRLAPAGQEPPPFPNQPQFGPLKPPASLAEATFQEAAVRFVGNPTPTDAAQAAPVMGPGTANPQSPSGAQPAAPANQPTPTTASTTTLPAPLDDQLNKLGQNVGKALGNLFKKKKP